MMRIDCKPELLAPAGTLETVEAVLCAGADAVYVGGKSLNMRMHRSSYNLDDQQLADAIALAHSRKRKLYLTLNSMIVEDELPQVRAALSIIGRLKPDAIIVQDLAVASLAREICVEIPLHASTMMNVHSIESAQALQMLGFTRVVTSRDIPLHEVRRIGEGSGLEMEYFVHGDMCIAQSSQCYGSGLLFGESSNRGRCMKSCRWKWELLSPDAQHPTGKPTYLLARKDLCLLEHVPLLLRNGIASLKIEGRMRTAEFLSPLVAAYRRAIDGYLADPIQYTVDKGTIDDVYGRRIRDFTTSLAICNSGPASVDTSGTREPRQFSLARREEEVIPPPAVPVPRGTVLGLAVHVGSAQAAEAAVQSGATAIYLGGDYFPGTSATITAAMIADMAAQNRQHGIRTALLGTRIADEQDLAEWRWMLARLAHNRDLALGVSTLGSLLVAREAGFRELLADFSLNVANSQAADELSTQGTTRVTASLELGPAELAALAERCRLPLEVIVQGPVPSMVMQHCPIAADAGTTPDDFCTLDCHRRGRGWAMLDTAGQRHMLITDRRCRSHLYMARDLCLLPHLADLARMGIKTVRIEAQHDSAETARVLTGIYRRAIDRLAAGEAVCNDDIEAIASATGRPQSSGLHAIQPVV